MKKSLFALTFVAALLVTASYYAPADAGSCSSSASTASAHDRPEKDLIDTAVGAGDFKTLAAALGAADLLDALRADGPYTVFAPTDAAFAKLPEGTVEELLKPENRDQLTRILTYHVVEGEVLAADVVKLEEASALSGDHLSIYARNGKVKIDGAKVVQTDILTSNGVIHVIDSVLIPN